MPSSANDQIMKEPIDFDESVRTTKELTGAVTLATGFYPRKALRFNRPRTRSERKALCQAVCYAVEQAKKSGLIVKTDEGYEMRW
jgi:hypothetical protein